MEKGYVFHYLRMMTMRGSWEGSLDIIGLNQNIRQKAKLKVLIEFPLGDPKTDLLLNLFEYIKKYMVQKNALFSGGTVNLILIQK
jgi:hypothetical protein